MNENKIDICQELHQNFIDFAYEANSQRAFADARDGLKPGQRACLWEFYSKGYTSNKPHVKSAKISGGVIANWWPHGDVAIYDTFARMSQSWINNIPEVDWHGANGNVVIGNAPASARYTEARLAKAIEDGMFCGIKKQNVPMIWNFSEDEQWPEVLPSILPRLLVNGCQGIGVTIANVFLPYNLNEVAAAIKNYSDTGVIDNKSVYPDFPSGGIIINKDELHLINETGKGKAIVRAKAEIKDKSILITELPYQVFVEPILEDIKKLIEANELTDIKEIYNKTDKKRLLIEIECKDNPAATLKQLYAKTDLQKNFNANQFALVGKTPKLLTLKDYFDIYLAHNQECIKKEYEFDLQKAKDRLEIVEGLLKALEDIDNVIALIKKSKNAAAAQIELEKKYNLTERQSKAIVDMKLGKIANLEKIELENENKELLSTIDKLTNILSNKEEIRKILLNRLDDYVKKYGYDRRTELAQISTAPEDKEIETIMPEDVVVIASQTGEIKKIPATSFRTQKRNTKGIKTKDDVILDTIKTNTIDTLMIFTDQGKMYKILVDNIPTGTNSTKGVSIYTLVPMAANEKMVAITSLERKTDAKYVVFITKKGLVKKTFIEEYNSVKKAKTGIAAIKLQDDDSIANVLFMKEEDLILITKQGMSIRFETKSIAAIGRVAQGVKSIKLGDGDEVLTGLAIDDENKHIAIIASNGVGKRVELNEFPIQGRNGKGVYIYKCINNISIIGAELVLDTNLLLISAKTNSLCVTSSDLPVLKRDAVGVIVIKDAEVISVTKI